MISFVTSALIKWIEHEIEQNSQEIEAELLKQLENLANTIMTYINKQVGISDQKKEST